MSHLPAPAGTRWGLTVQHTWNDHEVEQDEAVTVAIDRTELDLTVRIDAPFHDDPLPESDDLWKHEVVELMFVGADHTYLEVELSPHGPALVLFLRGERHVVDRSTTLDYRAHIDGRRWQGVAHIPLDWLPVDTDRLNAFAIHGSDPNRRYLAWKPTGGPQPDFHRLAAFGSFEECSL